MMALCRPMFEEYARELTALALEVKPITEDASPTEQLEKTLRKLRDRFMSLFAREAPRIADNVVGQIDKHSAASSQQSLKDTSAAITLKTKPTPKELRPALTAATKANVGLIKSIPKKYHQQIERAVIKSVGPGGRGLKTITDALLKYEGVTRRRAEFIALDQTRKVTADLNAERVTKAGAKKFRWIHSGGGAHPRELHKFKLNGQIFSYDDLPIIDERTGERGLPGQLPNCRCIAQPIVEFD
jgi:SPP1 gp7 family putative phage head morphogenesis protein